MTRTSKYVLKLLGVSFLVVTAATGAAVAETEHPGSKAETVPVASASGSASMPATSAEPSKTTSIASSSTKSQTGAGGMDGATYSVRLRDLEERIDELKEQIRRSHTRLSLLSDTILGGGVAGARAELTFENKMSSAFRLTRAVFVLDGAVQYNKSDDSGALSEQKVIPIYGGSIPPGDHTLQIMLEYKGHGYGVFSYLRGYKFEVKSSHSFTVTEGKVMNVRAVAYEKGGVTTPLEQRPAVRFTERVTKLKARQQSDSASKKQATGGTGASAPASIGGSVSVGGK